MAWELLALLTAVCETGKDLTARRLLRRGGLSSRLVMGLTCLLAALVAVPLALWLAPPPRWSLLLPSLAATALVNGLAFWAYGRALARGELSRVLPLINLSPVVLLLVGWLLLGERPTAQAVTGVLLVGVGALQLGRGTSLGSPGAWPMTLVAVLWGIGAGIDKLGVRAGGTLVWVAGFQLVVGVVLLLPAWLAGETDGLAGAAGGPAPRRLWLALLLLAVLAVVGMGLQMEALRRTAVVHVIAVKRLSTLMGAVVGVTWLGEPGAVMRLSGAALMLAGAVLVLVTAP